MSRKFAGPTTTARRARQALANLLFRHTMLHRDHPPKMTEEQMALADDLLGKTISNVGIELQRAILAREGGGVLSRSLWMHLIEWAGVDKETPRIHGRSRQAVYDLAKNLIPGLAPAEKRARDPEDGNRVGLGYVGYALATEKEREEQDTKIAQGMLL